MTDRSILQTLRRTVPMIGAALLGAGLALPASQKTSPPPCSSPQPRPGQVPLLIVGVLMASALVIVAFVSPRLAAAGWLIALITLSAIPLGALAWLMVHGLTGGHWGHALRPTFEAAALAIPLLFLALIPVLAAMPILYPWVAGVNEIKPDIVAFYLNVPLFILRAGIALIGWSVLALLLPRASGRAAILLAAAGLVFYALIVSLLSIDWILSAEPVFISTSFGATVAVTQMLAALGFAALFAPRLEQHAVRDLGGLMLARTLGVTYLNFMAVLVIWYGDLPTKVAWFVERSSEPWTAIAVAIFMLGAVIPVLLLLLARVRSSRPALRLVAISSLAGIALYDAWLLAPPFGVWALGTTVLAAISMGCASVVIVRAGWPAWLFDPPRATS